MARRGTVDDDATDLAIDFNPAEAGLLLCSFSSLNPVPSGNEQLDEKPSTVSGRWLGAEENGDRYPAILAENGVATG